MELAAGVSYPSALCFWSEQEDQACFVPPTVASVIATCPLLLNLELFGRIWKALGEGQP